jgi:hypothetical protein
MRKNWRWLSWVYPLSQELLDQDANFPTGWLLVLHLINDNRLEAGGTDLEQFTDPTSIRQGQGRQSGGIQDPSVQRLRLEQDCSRGHRMTKPDTTAFRWC